MEYTFKSIKKEKPDREERKKELEERKREIEERKAELRRRRRRRLLYWLTLILVFILLRACVYTPMKVRGNTMTGTLNNNDHVIMSKLGKIHRSDIVIISGPKNYAYQLMVRVIGMPGDTIEYRDDVLYVDGEEVDEPYLDKYYQNLATGELLTSNFDLYGLQSFVQESKGIKMDLNSDGTIPTGKYLLLGDNRQVSEDSRIYGLVDREDIEGKIVFRTWPLNRISFIH